MLPLSLQRTARGQDLVGEVHGGIGARLAFSGSDRASGARPSRPPQPISAISGAPDRPSCTEPIVARPLTGSAPPHDTSAEPRMSFGEPHPPRHSPAGDGTSISNRDSKENGGFGRDRMVIE